MFRSNLKYLWIFVIFNKALCDVHEDNWVDSDAWAREYQHVLPTSNDEDVCRKCPVERNHFLQSHSQTDEHKELTITIYKKFIAALFHREKLKFDSISNKYTRTVGFYISREQLEKIKQYNDPRDLDTVLVDILNLSRSLSVGDYGQSEASGSSMSISAIIGHIFKDFKQLLKTSEIQFSLIALLVAIIGWYLQRRTHWSLFWIFLFGTFATGYFIQYLECNKKLAVEQLIKVLETVDKSAEEDTKVNWFTRTWRSFWGEKEDKLTNNLRESASLNLSFCRPDHVLILFFNEAFLKFTESLIEFSAKVLDRLGWWSGLLLVPLIGYIIKLTFEFILSPRNWAGAGAFLNSSSTAPSSVQENKNTTNPAVTTTEDRLSGDNLRLILSAITHSSLRSIQNGLPASGVEDIKQQIKDAPTIDGSSSSSDNSSTSSSNGSSPEKSADGKKCITGNNNEIKKECDELGPPINQ